MPPSPARYHDAARLSRTIFTVAVASFSTRAPRQQRVVARQAAVPRCSESHTRTRAAWPLPQNPPRRRGVSESQHDTLVGQQRCKALQHKGIGGFRAPAARFSGRSVATRRAQRRSDGTGGETRAENRLKRYWAIGCDGLRDFFEMALSAVARPLQLKKAVRDVHWKKSPLAWHCSDNLA